MPERIPIGRGATALPLNNLIRHGEGYGWVDGGGVALGDNQDSIEIDVREGVIRAAGDLVNFESGSVNLPDGDPQYPRRDLIYVDYLGTIGYIQGEALQTKYEPEDLFHNPVPAPPAADVLDGVPLAEVWVPARATNTGNLEREYVNDARIADIGGRAMIPVLDSDPSRSELVHTRVWRNTSAGAFRAYVEDQDAIVELSTSTVTSFSGPTTRLIEGFEQEIWGSWTIRYNGFGYNNAGPVFEGTNSASNGDDFGEHIRSVSGDGLPYYPAPGDTIGLAINFGTGTDQIELGFAKETDEWRGDYRARVDQNRSLLQLVRTDPDGTSDVLRQAATPSITPGTYYIIETDYDGGGLGVHNTRLWSTSTTSNPGTRDTVVAELENVAGDMEYRGRGLAVRSSGLCRLDYLHAITD